MAGHEAGVVAEGPEPGPRQGPAPGPFVVTGMHRSGTSLVAQAFTAAGVFMGRNLLPPTRSNRRGHVEPWHIVSFHDRLLSANQTAWWDLRRLARGPLTVPPPWPNRARAIIARQFGRVERWGFKDPRATLFLDLWDDVLPRPHYVFVVRHPAAVAMSLLQRGDHLGTSDEGQGSRARVALQLWRVYNERILRFRRERPRARATVLVLEDVVGGSNGSTQADRLREVIGIDIAAAFDPDLLSEGTPGWLQDMAAAEGTEGFYEDLRGASRHLFRHARHG